MDETPQTPTSKTIKGLNGLLFCLSDVRHGIGPLLTIYLKSNLSWDPRQIGLVLAMPDLASLLFQAPAGYLADASRSKRLLIALPCLFIFLGSFLILHSSLFGVIMAAQFIMGLAIAIIAPAISSITLGLFGRQRLPRRITINEMWNHAGNVFTALTAGLAGYLLGNQWIFYVVILFGIASLIALSFIRAKEINYSVARELPEPDSITGQKSVPLPLIKLFKNKQILVFNFILIIYYITNGAQMALVGQMVSQAHPTMTALFIASCMIIAEVTMVLVAFGMRFIVNRLGRKVIFLIAFSVLPVRAFLYALTDAPLLLLGIQILDGFAAGILGVICTVINSDLGFGTGHFNFLQGLSAFSISIGVVLSNVIAGIIAEAYGFHIGFLSLASVGLIGILFSSFFMPETKDSRLSF